MPLPKTGASEVVQSKGLDVCNNWDLGPLDLLKCRALACYQTSSEGCFVCVSKILQVPLFLIIFKGIGVEIGVFSAPLKLFVVLLYGQFTFERPFKVI